MRGARIVACGLRKIESVDIERWTSVIDALAVAEAAGSPTYEQFIGFARGYVPEVAFSPFVIVLTADFTLAQKWLLMVALDEFLEQEVISDNAHGDWEQVWMSATTIFEEGVEFLEQNQDSLDVGRLDRAWQRLRAAAS